MLTYFVVAREDELARMRSLDDVLVHVEQTEPMLGGNMSLKRVAALSQVFLQSPERMPSRTGYALADGSRFYLVDSETCEKVASSEHEQLLAASAAWDDAAWQGTDVNRMDLAGFLLDLSALCKQAQEKRSSLYILPPQEE